MTKDQIKSAAMELDPNEREALAEELFQSLSSPEQQAIDAAQLEEAKRRYETFIQSGAVANTSDEVVARIKNSIRR
jgi:putative addiction module component (TIGR02574 family)